MTEKSLDLGSCGRGLIDYAQRTASLTGDFVPRKQSLRSFNSTHYCSKRTSLVWPFLVLLRSPDTAERATLSAHALSCDVLHEHGSGCHVGRLALGPPSLLYSHHDLFARQLYYRLCKLTVCILVPSLLFYRYGQTDRHSSSLRTVTPSFSLIHSFHH